MKKLTKWLFSLLLPFCMTAVAFAEDYTEGKQYMRLSNPQPTAAVDKVEVVELFWYGCPHCYYLEPFINTWLENKPENVVFVRMPAIVGPRWEPLAKAYYTAEVLGVLDQMHEALFKAIHDKQQKFPDEAALQDFFVANGVTAEDFKKAYNSFAVSVKVNNTKMMTRRYAISGVPTVIVNGKFSTSGSLAGSNEGIIKVLDYLIAQELAAEGAATATTAQP